MTVIETVLDKTFTETPSVSKRSTLRVIDTILVLSKACLVQLGTPSDLQTDGD